MKRKFYTIPEEAHHLSKKFLSLDMFNALEYPEEYGLAKRRKKGSVRYQIEIVIKRIAMPKRKPRK